MTARLNLKIYRGTSFAETFVWTENGLPVDLTTWQAKIQIKPDSGTPAYTLSSADGQIILGADGSIAVTLDPAFTATMAVGSYDWDILLMDATGFIQPPLLYGIVTVYQGVTTW